MKNFENFVLRTLPLDLCNILSHLYSPHTFYNKHFSSETVVEITQILYFNWYFSISEFLVIIKLFVQKATASLKSTIVKFSISHISNSSENQENKISKWNHKTIIENHLSTYVFDASPYEMYKEINRNRFSILSPLILNQSSILFLAFSLCVNNIYYLSV